MNRPWLEEALQEDVEEAVKRLSSLQRLHYASHHRALLVFFQGMDAAGKDGAIRHVMSGVNPQGCQVFSFNDGPGDRFLDYISDGTIYLTYGAADRSVGAASVVMAELRQALRAAV